MLAAVLAAITSFQKIFFCKHDVPFFRVIEVIWFQAWSTEIIVHFVHVCKVNNNDGEELQFIYFEVMIPTNEQQFSLATVQEVSDFALVESGIRLLIKRDDLIHEHISGNKWRKLKYNLSEAVQQNHHTLLTFGGTYSNHIAATAFAAEKAGFSSIGVIRGEDDASNPTMKFAREHGMQLYFVSREDYRKKNDDDFINGLEEKFGRFFLIPEGGANGLGVRGCAEILPEIKEDFDVVCSVAGTGTTLAGLSISLRENQKLLGFPALKGADFLSGEIERLMGESGLRPPSTINHQLITDYHFGGYAKMKPDLLEFIQGFTERTGIPLDPIYTGKMMFGIYDLIRNGFFPKRTVILAIHSGGLQGWLGMKHRNLV